MNLNVKQEIKNIILSFEGPFTVREIIQLLREKNIVLEDDRELIIKNIHEILESYNIYPITNSNEFYIKGKEKTW